MRLTLALALLAGFASSSFAAAKTNNIIVVGTNTATKKLPPVVLTNAPVVTNVIVVETNKVTIKDLLLLPAFTNDTGMVLVKVAPGSWVGKYEVTQGEYQKIAGANPSQFRGDRNPVDSVSWNEAMAFCAALNDAELKAEMLPDGMTYTLPTQGQWEAFSAGTDLKLAVTSNGTSRRGTSPVGSLGENGLGLCDVRGNVWEWCLDPQDKPFRVLRGAGWDTSYEPQLRPDFRWYGNGPDDKKNDYGFRCVLIAAPR